MLLLRNFRPILLVVVINFVCSFSAASAEGLNSQYFPLAVGNKWVLHSEALNTDISFEVVELKDGIYQVRFNNPWTTWEYSLFPINDKTYIQNLHIGEFDYSMGGLALYYDFTATSGTSLDLVMGTLTITNDNHSCATTSKTYTGCLTLDLVDAGGFQQSWTFAPGFGIVNYSMAGFPFALDEAKSTVDTNTSGNDIPTWTGPVQKGNRVLAIDVNTNDSNDYNSAIVKAQEAGMQDIGLHFSWNVLETEPNQYQIDIFDIINFYYPSVGVNLHLTIAPIHHAMNLLPADLKDLPFDHPEVIARYKKLLDVLFARIPDVNLKTLVVGSEIDAHMGIDPIKWAQYENFYQQVSDYARSIRSELKIATEFTFMQGFYGAARPFLISINAHSDVIGISYYPKDIEGMVLDPEVVPYHVKAMVEAFPVKDLYFYQLGFPSSSLLQSSEPIQAEFIRKTFQAWDLYADQVKLVDFTFLHNLSDQEIDVITDEFDIDSVLFTEFLNSLGLLKYDSSLPDKEAYSAVQEEGHIRGW